MCNDEDETLACARKLVGHFKSSSQATSRLLEVQESFHGKGKTVVVDVKTRWWSTLAMCRRLLELKCHFNSLEKENELDCNLTEKQWKTIELVCKLLAPFGDMQQLLEGEKYISGSIVCLMISTGREHLVSTIANADLGSVLHDVASKLLDDFNYRWGDGNNVFTENNTRVARNRQKGIPLKLLQASVLDPRFKFLPGVNNADRSAIWTSVRDLCLAMDEQTLDAHQLPPDPPIAHQVENFGNQGKIRVSGNRTYQTYCSNDWEL